MSKPLYVLATNNNLPLHQELDAATIEWAKNNNPFDPHFILGSISDDTKTMIIHGIKSASKVTIDTYETLGGIPFFRVNSQSTIHGELHAVRVAFFATFLTMENKNIKPIHAAIAGMLHDIARANDQADEGHGIRSAVLAKEYLSDTLPELTASEIDKIAQAIKLHEEQDLSDLDDLSAAVKVADALDRYRLPKTKWWPDAVKMAFVPDQVIFYLAYRLILLSEQKVLNGADYISAFRESVDNLIHEVAI